MKRTRSKNPVIHAKPTKSMIMLKPQHLTAIDRHEAKDTTSIVDMIVLAPDLHCSKSQQKRGLMHLDDYNTFHEEKDFVAELLKRSTLEGTKA